jgi:hypothetical protein
MLHVIGVEKNSLARVLGAQNVGRRFALNVIRIGVVKGAFDVVGRLKSYHRHYFGAVLAIPHKKA